MMTDIATFISTEFGVDNLYKISPHRIKDYHKYCILYAGRRIEFVDSYDWLGTQIDSMLQFEKHQWDKIKSFQLALNSLNGFGTKYTGASRRVLKQLYTGNIRPKILYCISLSYGCESKQNIFGTKIMMQRKRVGKTKRPSEKLCTRLELINRQAIRLITRTHKHSSYVANHVETDISTLHELIASIKLRIIHRVFNLDEKHRIRNQL